MSAVLTDGATERAPELMQVERRRGRGEEVARIEFGDPGSYMDLYNRSLDKGRSGSDVPHRGVITALYDMRTPHLPRYLRGALSGWQAGAIAVLQSGQPFTVYDSAEHQRFPRGHGAPARDRRPNGRSAIAPRWFNIVAFQSAPPYTFGNSPRSVLRGPAWKTLDLTLSKNFRLRERWRTEIRGEFFNALDHANFDIPGHILGNADFGVISSAEPARTVQLAARLVF